MKSIVADEIGSSNENEPHRRRLTRQAAGSFTLNIVSNGLGFLSALLFARVLGVQHFGAYMYAMSWVTLLNGLGLLGMDTLLIRLTAVYQKTQQWGLARGLMRWSAAVTLGTAVGMTGIAFVSWWVFRSSLPLEMQYALLVALFLMPIGAMVCQVQACLHGLQQVLLSQIPVTVLRPVIAMIVLGVAAFAFGENLTAANAIGVQAVALGISLAAGLVMLKLTIPTPMRIARGEYSGREWIGSALPLFVVGVLWVVNEQMDVLVVGGLEGSKAAGVISVAKRGAQLIIFPLLAVNSALSPAIAQFHAVEDHYRLQQAVTKSARVVFVSSLAIALSLLIFGSQFLELFGDEFLAGEEALQILILGQMLNSVMGSVAPLLIMTGHGRALAIMAAFGCVVRIILLFGLIPMWGVAGAAAAATVSIVVIKLAAIVVVLRVLNIDPTALGMLGKGMADSEE